MLHVIAEQVGPVSPFGLINFGMLMANFDGRAPRMTRGNSYLSTWWDQSLD